MIGSVPASIMRWIGGGIDPFQDNATNEGKGFAQHVIGRGEAAAQAGMAANKGRKERNLGEDRHQQQMDAQNRQTDAINNQSAASNKLSDQLMRVSNGGGDGGGGPVGKDQGSH